MNDKLYGNVPTRFVNMQYNIIRITNYLPGVLIILFLSCHCFLQGQLTCLAGWFCNFRFEPGFIYFMQQFWVFLEWNEATSRVCVHVDGVGVRGSIRRHLGFNQGFLSQIKGDNLCQQLRGNARLIVFIWVITSGHSIPLLELVKYSILRKYQWSHGQIFKSLIIKFYFFSINDLDLSLLLSK